MSMSKFEAFKEGCRLLNVAYCEEQVAMKTKSVGSKMIEQALLEHGMSKTNAAQAKAVNFGGAPVQCGLTLGIDLPLSTDCLEIFFQHGIEQLDLSVAFFVTSLGHGRWILFLPFDDWESFNRADYGFLQISRRCKRLGPGFLEEVQLAYLSELLLGTQMQWHKYDLVSPSDYMTTHERIRMKTHPELDRFPREFLKQKRDRLDDMNFRKKMRTFGQSMDREFVFEEPEFSVEELLSLIPQPAETSPEVPPHPWSDLNPRCECVFVCKDQCQFQDMLTI